MLFSLKPKQKKIILWGNKLKISEIELIRGVRPADAEDKCRAIIYLENRENLNIELSNHDYDRFLSELWKLKKTGIIFDVVY